MRSYPALALAFALASSALLLPAQFHPRITQHIDEQRTVRLPGNRHPLANPQTDDGPADASHPMQRMILTLQASPSQQADLDSLIAAQHDPQSPLFHKWLTPAEFGMRFGVGPTDTAKVAAWLKRHGLTIDEIPVSGRSIIFSGAAAQVQSAFHAEIRQFKIHGETHIANATDPEIPQALAGVVGGVVTLHNFRRQAFHSQPTGIGAQYTYGSNHYMSPADFATIYNTAALYAAGIDGTGQTIAIVGRTNIRLSDVQTFRSTSGLRVNDPVIVLNGADPGVVNSNEEAEADLDVEWSGAVAPGATVKFVISASTNATDGVDLSASYIVNHNLAPVMSTSFGSCEAFMGSSENAFYNNLWQQAAAQGITTLIASGDSGAAGCDYGSTGVNGPAINGLCSSPYSVCVGGTQFNEAGNPTAYWSASNNSASRGSALTYIPEVAWNESGSNGGNGLWATGGGASILYSKPAWQTGRGVPADGHRDVPDVALTAAGHDGYLYYQRGVLGAIAGTSASSPAFAGLMALVNQGTQARQGNANTTFYALAALQNSGSGTSYFHASTGGTNSVPGVNGFSAATNYNQATGLGSVDANLLVTHWNDSSIPTFQVTAPATATATLGTSASVNGAVSLINNFNAAVALSVTGAPSGVTATLSTSSFAAPGSGSFTLAIDATAALTQGAFPLQISAASGTQTSTATVTLTLTGPTFRLTGNTPQISLVPGGTAAVTLNTAAGSGFNSALALSVSGTFPGVTASLSASSLAAPGTGTATLTVAAASSGSSGSSALVITAVGGGVTKTVTIPTVVGPSPGCTLQPSSGPVSVSYGYLVSFQISCIKVVGGFSTPLQMTASGMLAGSVVRVTPPTLTPGSGVSTVSIQPSDTATAGTVTLMITGTGGGVTVTLPMSVTVKPQPNYLFAISGYSATMTQGASAALSISTAHVATYNAPVALSTRGLPAGITAVFQPNSIAAPGDGSSTLTFTADPKLSQPGTYPNVMVSALGSGLMKSIAVTLIVNPAAAFTVTASASSLTAQQSSSGSLQLTTTGTGNPAVAFSITGSLPVGVTASFATSATTAQTRTTLFTLTVGSAVPAGTYPVNLSSTYKTQTTVIPVTFVVTATPAPVQPSFTLTAAATASVNRGSSVAVAIRTTANNGFVSALKLSVGGLPSGVTAVFSPARISDAATGSTVLTLTAAAGATVGTPNLTITATCNVMTKTATVALTIR